MTVVQPRTISVPKPGDRKPRDEELDLFGLTHPGKVRKENQDHFLVCTVHPEVVVHGTSLASIEHLPLRGERLATLMLVADGVGGSAAGGEASQLATETITGYVASTLRCYHAAGSSGDAEFYEALRAAALEAHEAVSVEGASRGGGSHPGGGSMATTLTLAIAVWPWLYVVQVGDSRCYRYSRGVLSQVTRDQTIAQHLVEQGILHPDQAAKSPLSSVLASSIGGREASPEVNRIDIRRREASAVLVCSDGLTREVSDEEIAEQLGAMESSEQVSRDLLNLALERGGRDNITIVVARVKPEDDEREGV
jgi:protein phosphatase